MLAFVDRRCQYPGVRGLGVLFAGPELPVGIYERVLNDSRRYGELPVPVPPNGGRNSTGVLPYVPNDNQICIRTVTSTTYTGLKCSGSIYNQLTVFTVPATTTTASVGSQITVVSHVLSAQLIQLNWQSSDRASLSSSAMSTAVAEPNPSSPKQSSESRGLTTGAKAGIGIGVSIGAIGVGILIWYLVRRFQKERPALPAPPDRASVRELDGKQMYEIPAPSAPAWELPGHGS
ncbi:hypothetical protein F4825DRAFT_456424 [Nemania diffusa]|nr:hypothetical protein F4825DRAFT_456424 [Nemania diffusa]